MCSPSTVWEASRAHCGVAMLGQGTPDGLRALINDKPDHPAAVTRHLDGNLGEAVPAMRSAMETLARSFPPKELTTRAYSLYEELRPAAPISTRGGTAATSTLRSSRNSYPEASRAARRLVGALPFPYDRRVDPGGLDAERWPSNSRGPVGKYLSSTTVHLARGQTPSGPGNLSQAPHPDSRNPIRNASR